MQEKGTEKNVLKTAARLPRCVSIAYALGSVCDEQVGEWIAMRIELHEQQKDFVMTRIPLIQAEEDARLRSERLNLSIAEMGLSVRTTNCLEETGILTVRDLLNATPRRLLSISNFGEKTLDEVYAALEKLGFYRPSRQTANV